MDRAWHHYNMRCVIHTFSSDFIYFLPSLGCFFQCEYSKEAEGRRWIYEYRTSLRRVAVSKLTDDPMEKSPTTANIKTRSCPSNVRFYRALLFIKFPPFLCKIPPFRSNISNRIESLPSCCYLQIQSGWQFWVNKSVLYAVYI